ncbi:alpha/beta fold hydrolase [Fervidobacterium nodosum]|uniref:Alpha/beta hydrolase fold-5 domain-containing protein n=1 Tax=Fervidobacterium nodosum (strain ATCC 35602 / DSM 5306 / Rt17-B1) TaxID=381764 RepID=A7HL84_FERNB|nr:alpha/beta fold hydrolase [Fervidobacterium nodosum]ABS60667.1 conserved hypothetical protein [Fervidobacterium nodosum Rt17-B1]PHJ13562.1 hypothetical protein IM41_05625 [Fervidobacterium sp. SC_NGM5_G05]
MKEKRTKRLFSALILLAILVVLFVWLFNYLNYKPEEIVKNYLVSSEKVSVKIEREFIVFSPVSSTDKTKIDIIFYPGGFVYPEAYSPLCYKISENGYRVFLAKMPLNLAVLKPNIAGEIVKEYNLKKVVLAGHSLGGAMAAKFAYDNPDKVTGLILLGAYPAKQNNLSNSNIKVLSLFGELDGLATVEKIEKYKELLPKDTKYFMILGGNHSNFGYYGFQKKDNPSKITKEEQQSIILEKILEFLDKL